MKYVVKHNALFLSDKNGVTHTHERGDEVELDADTAERLLRYGTVVEPSKDEEAPAPEPKRTRRAAQPSQPAPEAVKDADVKE